MNINLILYRIYLSYIKFIKINRKNKEIPIKQGILMSNFTTYSQWLYLWWQFLETYHTSSVAPEYYSTQQSLGHMLLHSQNKPWCEDWFGTGQLPSDLPPKICKQCWQFTYRYLDELSYIKMEEGVNKLTYPRLVHCLTMLHITDANAIH